MNGLKVGKYFVFTIFPSQCNYKVALIYLLFVWEKNVLAGHKIIFYFCFKSYKILTEDCLYYFYGISMPCFGFGRKFYITNAIISNGTDYHKLWSRITFD